MRFVLESGEALEVPRGRSVLGTGADARLRVAGEGVLPEHISILFTQGRVWVQALENASLEINGTAVPGLNTRNAHTVVEMKEGQTLAMAGLLSGRMMRHQMAKSEAPSMRAASSSSMGMVLIYWRMRKMLVTLTLKGTMMPMNLLIQPSLRITRKSGVISTAPGMVSVASSALKINSRPQKRRRAKA